MEFKFVFGAPQYLLLIRPYIAFPVDAFDISREQFVFSCLSSVLKVLIYVPIQMKIGLETEMIISALVTLQFCGPLERNVG